MSQSVYVYLDHNNARYDRKILVCRPGCWDDLFNAAADLDVLKATVVDRALIRGRITNAVVEYVQRSASRAL